MWKVILSFGFSCCVVTGAENGFAIFSSTFGNAIKRPLPFQWERSKNLENFRQDFANITQKLLENVLLEYFVDAAQHTKLEFTIDRYIRKLTYQDGGILTNQSVDDALIGINDVLNGYFKVLPENNKETKKVLPELPKFQPKLEIKNHQLSEKFDNLKEILDYELHRFYLLIGNLYLEGWQETRPVLAKVHEHFGDTFLYSDVLVELTKGVKKVKASHANIQAHAREDVWKNFTASASVVLKLHRKLHKSNGEEKLKSEKRESFQNWIKNNHRSKKKQALFRQRDN